MSNTVIKVENVSKQYRLGEIGTGSITHDLNRWWHKIRGNEDPYLKIGETNDRTSKGNSQYVWALKDINFEVKKGEVLGIIGRNGAGKSTLLKILSRTTLPTTGSIKIKGRVASLLEVGTGFHPDLSGRDNIYLNGAILGMSKREIDKKFDEIVDFAGVERYIDTPVKRYSSGMYVRLAFAVAAHLEPEILIVDEVLAVGDAEFQKKCLGKMKDVSVNDGRTVLFVSHNLTAVQKLCTTGVLLSKGLVGDVGGIDKVINNYNDNKLSEKYFSTTIVGINDAVIKEVSLIDLSSSESYEFASGETWKIKIVIEVFNDINHFVIGTSMMNVYDLQIRTNWTTPTEITKGVYEFILTENEIYFAPGSYNFYISISNYHVDIEHLKMPFTLSITDVSMIKESTYIVNMNYGILNNPLKTEMTKIS